MRQPRPWVRWSLYTTAAAALLVAAIVGYAAFLLNGDGVRARVAAALTRALGRPVTMAHLQLSPWTGAAVADDFRIADDPEFSTDPFVRAAHIRIGLDAPALLFHRDVRIRSIVLQAPEIHLLRDVAGRWNYTTFAHGGQPRPAGERLHTASIDISSIAVEQGSVLVQTTGFHGEAVRRSFGIEALQVRDVGAGKQMPFTLSAKLPGGGSVAASGIARSRASSDAGSTSVRAHVEAGHLDLLAAGLVGADAAVTGELEHVAADLQWSGDALAVSQVRVDGSRLSVRPDQEGVQAATAERTAATVWKELLQRLTVNRADVRISALNIIRAHERPVRLRAVSASLQGWAQGARAHFVVSAGAAGGTVHATGTGHVPTAEGEQQPLVLDAEVSTARLNLAQSGLLSEGAAVDATVDSSIRVRSNQGTLEAGGTFRLAGLRLAHAGQPSTVPVSGSFHLHQQSRAKAGTLHEATVHWGEATLHAAGTYAWGGIAPTVRLTVTGDRMPVDALEASLPSAGVVLPDGSRLQGGTLTLQLQVEGPLAHPEVSGPVRLEGTRLAGFDLGARLRSLASFTGGRLGSATAQGTELRSLSFVLHTGAGLVVTDQIVADIAGVGTATGTGNIGPGGTLDYRLTLKLNELVAGEGGPSGLANQIAGALSPTWARRLQGAVRYLSQGPMRNGVPLLIRGTARKPSVTPDLGALLPGERRR